MKRLLITGATGFVGMELLARYIERSDHELVTLVRARTDREAQDRVERVLENLFGNEAERRSARVSALAGELTAPRLGLSEDQYRELSQSLTGIVHSAASVSFDLPLQEARAINLEGTRSLLELAANAPALERYAHISTAYVAGTHAGRFRERDLDLGQRFRNTYEQSKFEAEQLIRSRPEIPSTILRPSIIVGERRSGWTAAFNVLYWPLRAFARGLFSEVPGVPSSPLDVVPVDYVADAICALCDTPDGIGQTYHLTAGAEAGTLQDLADAASRYFKRPAPRVIPPDRQVNQDQAGSQYFPYLAVETVFDDTATRRRLEPLGIRSSPLGEYLDRLLDFATRSAWGKRPISRFQALAA